MRVLITGSSGRIGSAIARRVSRQHEVVGLDIRPGQWTSISADICDASVVWRELARVDAVIHTASLHAPDVGVQSGSEFRRINVDGTRILHRGVDERDVAEAHLLALTTPVKELAILNVSAQPPFEKGDCEMLVRDAAWVIRARVPWAEEEFRRRGWRLPRSIDRVYVVENAARVMGWIPRYGLQAFLDGE